MTDDGKQLIKNFFFLLIFKSHLNKVKNSEYKERQERKY